MFDWRSPNLMLLLKPVTLLHVLLLLSTFAPAQEKPRQNHHEKAAAPAEDISGMYSFLREGEFVQINIEQNGVSGYISRRGDLESDRGAFLDQFFSKASIEGHDVSFTTKPLHGVTYDFKGRWDRGKGKSKTEDGYYVLRGMLKETVNEGGANATSRSKQVEFRLLAQPPEQDGKEKD